MAIGSVYRPMLETARELGVDIDAVLDEVDLSYAQLLEDDARLTPDQGRALARAFVRHMPEQALRYQLGLRAAERFVASDAGLLGYMLCHSEHALAAAEMLTRFARLVGDSADYHAEIGADRVTIKLGLSGGRHTEYPEGEDFTVAVFFRLLCECSGGRTRPIEVRLTRPRPPRPQLYRRFFAAPVKFGAALPALVYERASMLAPLAQGDAKLVRILKQQAELQQQSLPSDAVRDRVRALIAAELSRGSQSLASIALRCGVGERTLRRRLELEGTSYRALVDEVRKERALALLDREHSVTEVAQHLGFSDATAFTRAFRRWTGSLPRHVVRAARRRERDAG